MHFASFSRRSSHGLAALVFGAALAACYVGGIPDEGAAAGGPGGPGGPETGAPPTSVDPRVDPPVEARGIPCAVDALLGTYCRSCHHAGQTSLPSLGTYEDLVGPSKFEPSRVLAEVALERIADGSMPPKGAKPSAAERAAFEEWVASGTPRGTCGGGGDAGPGPDPARTDGGPPPEPDAGPAPVVCTSGQTWSSNREGPTMNPGRACITCHQAREGEPLVQVGGTVYPTLHEPDLCLGVPGQGVKVVITDATGRVAELPVGPTGNFSLSAEAAALAMPIRAKVVTADGRERAMRNPKMTGDCNGCHTEQGANGAPGRIFLP